MLLARRALLSPWAPAGLVLGLYGLWLLALLHSTGYDPLIPTAGPPLTRDPRDFAYIGTTFLDRGADSSPVIHRDPNYHGYDVTGYDGEFFYFMALDPTGARPYIDTPSYRYTRVVYPMVARLFALGQPGLVPWTLILVNWLALAGGTLALAAWLRRRGLSPWWSLVAAFYPGLLMALRFDLSEILAYCLVATGVLVYDLRRRWSVLVAGLLFGTAVLTKETAVIFPIALAVAALFGPWKERLGDRIRPGLPAAVTLGALGVGPYVVWKLVLLAWLGGLGAGLRELFEGLPFQGLVYYFGAAMSGGMEPRQAEDLINIVVPSTIVAVLVVLAFRRVGNFAAGWVVLTNYVLFVVFLHHNSYVDYRSAGRISAGLVLAAVMCLPVFLRLSAGFRAWFTGAALLWVALIPQDLIVPMIVVYGRAARHLLHG